MFIKDGIVYASSKSKSICVESAKPLSDGIIIVTFNTGEKRLLDTTELKGEAFEPLKNPDVFASLVIDHGVMTWNNGDIDCAPEYVYDHSYENPEKADAIA